MNLRSITSGEKMVGKKVFNFRSQPLGTVLGVDRDSLVVGGRKFPYLRRNLSIYGIHQVDLIKGSAIVLKPSSAEYWQMPFHEEDGEWATKVS